MKNLAFFYFLLLSIVVFLTDAIRIAKEKGVNPVKDPPSENLFAAERQIQILEMVRQRRKVTVSDLSRKLKVSLPTIRNDLQELHDRGLIVRTHGGAISRTTMGAELDTDHRQETNLPAKQAIAAAALEMIENGDRLILDTGTTTLELARRLSARRDITVVTNDLNIARTLEAMERMQIVFMGGLVRNGFHCTIGPFAIEFLKSLSVDKAFLGASSVSRSGAMTPDPWQAETKKSMMAAAAHVVLLADSSKFNQASFARFASLDEFDCLVTDWVDTSNQMAFHDSGVEVVVASQVPAAGNARLADHLSDNGTSENGSA
jgi:DeoR family fructose operon transcriptional repressor